MRRTLAAPGLAAVLGMALLLTACGKTNAHNNTAGETVSTALFDFSITDVSLVESYPGIDIPDGECLVRMRLNIKNTSSQTYTMFLQDFQIQWGEGDNDYGTCLNAVDDTMMPYAYELTPGQERSDWLMADQLHHCVSGIQDRRKQRRCLLCGGSSVSQQSRILAGVFCSGMAAALIAMAALQLPNWLQQRKMVSESPPVVQTAEPEQTPEPQVTAAPTVQPTVTPEPRDFTALLERNPEVIGWIKIDDTDVDLPVMQREGDNSYYLKHDLDGNWDDLGLPYLDYECDIQQSRHLILYGHNMGVGDTVRFSSLQNYREPEYYQEHPVIELDSLNGGQYYKIVAVYAITTRESDGDVFHFNQYVNFADDAAEQEYLDEVAKRAFYTTGDYARADERLLTLCTCTYEMSDARLLIMARPLRDGETLTADEVIINPDPLLPARWPAGA